MPRVVTAMDVGHDAVKVVTLADRPGMPEVTGVISEPLDELGRLEDGPEKLATLKMRLAKLKAPARGGLGRTVVPVSGRSAIIRYITVPPVPPWRLDKLMEFEADRGAGGSGTATGILKKDSRRLAAVEEGPEGAVAHDYRMLDVPDIDGQSLVLLALCREEAIAELTDLARSAGASDPDVELAAIGLYNAYVHGHGFERDEDRTVVLLDVGAEEVNLCVTRNGGLWFARHQRGGGRAFTEALKKAHGMSWAEAEEHKRSGARIYEAPSASEALSREAAELARAVEAAFMYARAQTKRRDLKIDRVLLSGGGARLAGLGDLLARNLHAEVMPLEPLRKISLGGLSSEETAPLEGTYCTFAVPLGLALSRLVPGAARLDLKTQAEKERREFRQRGLFLRAAVAVFVAGAVFWVAGAVRDRVVCASALKTASDQDNEDKSQLKAKRIAQHENDRLAAELDALRERVTSGEDLLRALSQLKKRTPSWIRLVAVSTKRPRSLEGGKPPEGAATFQGRRTLYVSGYASSRKSAEDAVDRVRKYQETLKEAKELFEQIGEEVDIGLLVPVESGAPGQPFLARFVFAVRIAKPR